MDRVSPCGFDTELVERSTRLVRLISTEGLNREIDYTPVDSGDESVGDEMTIGPE